MQLTRKCIFTVIFIGMWWASRAIPPQHAPDVTIHIEASSFFSKPKPFWIDIYKTRRTVKIVYSLEDSMAYKAMSRDKDYISADEMYARLMNPDSLMADSNYIDRWSNYTKDSLFRKLDTLYRKYAVCKLDSVSFDLQTDSGYAHLIEKIVASSKDELENAEANKRIIPDGVHFTFVIRSGSGARKVSAQAPNPKSHPLLYQFLEATLNAYRIRRNTVFLSQQRTYGY